jgi:hypothetical protein
MRQSRRGIAVTPVEIFLSARDPVRNCFYISLRVVKVELDRAAGEDLEHIPHARRLRPGGEIVRDLTQQAVSEVTRVHQTGLDLP